MKTKLSLNNVFDFLKTHGSGVETPKLGVSTRLLFLFLALSPVPCALSQIPQGYNYQAVARNASGIPIASQPIPVRMTIMSDSLGGTIFWQELHSSVTTNPQGVINLVVGKGARESASTVTTFSNIDWAVTPIFLKTEINYSGWKTLGVSRLWSVPYAQVARDLDGPLKKLSVEGETAGLEEALFEVKNRDGQTVFAVYNEGVRVYVSDGAKALKGGFAVGGFGTDKAESTKYLFVGKDSVRIYLDTNPLTKGKKSGFAVGGYDLTKGTVQNYLDVSSDSVRIYIDSDPDTKKLKGGFAVGGYDMTKGNVQDYLDVSADSIRLYIDDTGSGKGKKGGFAVGGFDLTKDGNKNFLNIEIDTSGKINPSNNRILWYPLKNAFLTGKVLVESRDSVGENSFASGFESKSKGQYSQALGFKAIARGDYSTAIGKNAIANNTNSFAFGEDAKARNEESYAIGRGAVASGYRSFAFGSAGIDDLGNPTRVASASGDYSFAIGQGSLALGKGAFAIGLADSAKGEYSIALGYRSSTRALGATAIGNRSVASNYFATAIGNSNTAKGNCSTALGSNCIASLGSSMTLGAWSNATAVYATAMGWHTTASGVTSMSMGYYTYARGELSTAMGNFTKARPFASVSLGQYNDTTCSSGGLTTWTNTDPVFIIGNGTANTARSNAFTVLKNGNTAIGHTSPTQMLDVNGNARFRIVGSGTFNRNLNLTSDGTLTTSTSDISMKENINQITDALENVAKLRGVYFTWKNDSLKLRQIGMVAQEVEPILPEIVFTNNVDGLKGINYSQATALLVEAIKEQQVQISDQKGMIELQQRQIDELKVMVEEMKNR